MIGNRIDDGFEWQNGCRFSVGFAVSTTGARVWILDERVTLLPEELCHSLASESCIAQMR